MRDQLARVTWYQIKHGGMDKKIYEVSCLIMAICLIGVSASHVFLVMFVCIILCLFVLCLYY